MAEEPGFGMILKSAGPDNTPFARGARLADDEGVIYSLTDKVATPQLTATELCDMVDSILHLLLGWSYTWQCLYIKWERYRHKVGRNNKAIWCK